MTAYVKMVLEYDADDDDDGQDDAGHSGGQEADNFYGYGYI